MSTIIETTNLLTASNEELERFANWLSKQDPQKVLTHMREAKKQGEVFVEMPTISTHIIIAS